MNLKNSKGSVWYGMHFYPGVAEYREQGKEPFRVFLNEDTLRAMDPTFQGRPIFVEHVDEVESNKDELRKEADGWVLESFFNQADGKHWVKFIIVSERGERAIARGMRLSNAYIPQSYGPGGLWNGVSYSKQILNGEFEHLAIVQDPRYDESVIMTPEEFKRYNEENVTELKKVANSKDKKGESKMAFSLFKKTKVDNALDIEGMSVVLPKSGKEKTIAQLVNEADEAEKKSMSNDGLADPSHKVKLHDGSYCNVGELVEKHKAMHDELEKMKSAGDEEEKKENEDADADMQNKDDEEDKKENADADEGAKKKALEIAEHEEKEIAEAKKSNELEEKRKESKEKAERLKNANLKFENKKPPVTELMSDQIARGTERYGSK